MKLRLLCLVWPDDNPDEHIVEVELDSDRTVAFLKKLIKAEHARRLHNVDAQDLALWKCSIPCDDNMENALNAIRFDGTATDLLHLPPFSPLSDYFATGFPPKTIHILVEVPGLSEYHERDIVGELPEFRSAFSLTFCFNGRLI